MAGLRLQVTPAALESFVTVAVIVMAWPPTAFCVPLGPRVMLIGSGGEPDPDPDEHPDIRPATIKAKQNSLFIGRLLLLKQRDSNDAGAFRKIKKTRVGDDKGFPRQDCVQKGPPDHSPSLRSFFVAQTHHILHGDTDF